MKLPRWFSENILFAATIFLLAFIPLYPKLPIVDIVHTWVYIRLEDFLVAFVILLWIGLVLFKRVSLKTPLTLPIILFFLIGGISTLHGVLLIFPTLSDVFSNIALLSFLRRIEYLSVFFIAYTGVRDKKFLSYVIVALVVILLLVTGYGIGQKFLGFPAFLTMNEEFAKGTPIRLSQLSRIPSTFAGHYDLAAYLVLMIPILTSMVFGIRKWAIKIILLTTIVLGFGLLFMTVSRVSFFVLFLSLGLLLVFQKKRFVILSLFALTIMLLIFSPSLLDRFKSTVTEVDVLVDTQTGGAIRQVKEVPASYFDNKIILRSIPLPQEVGMATSSASPLILPHVLIPAFATLSIDPTAPNGESLPQGTSYINLPLSPVIKRTDQYFYEKPTNQGSQKGDVRVTYGEFLIKKAKAFDLSFTTRFQGEWPRTINAFKRNIFLGSGYGSVSLAVDNDYLRTLGESGIFGFMAFISIFLIAGIYIQKTLQKVDSPIVRSFVFGFVAGSFGLALNALLIDVFEASKIAFTYWLLMGVTLGTLHLYSRKEEDVYEEYKKALRSPFAIVIYLLIITIALFSSSQNYYFVGDDYTWFRWVSDCSSVAHSAATQCPSIIKAIVTYFTDANGFFYRPGTKLYFSFMYSAFWLNQAMYHLVSISLHVVVAVLLFFVSKKITKDHFLASGSAALFLILSGHHEAIYWISATGFLFNAVFALASLLSFIYWKERKKRIYFIASVIFIIFSLLFHELGVIVPLIIILYDIFFGEKTLEYYKIKKIYIPLLFPIVPYLLLRFSAHSHWFSGDYSYNLLRLPYNVVGNTIGYLALTLLGSSSLPILQGLRNFSKEHIIFAIMPFIIAIITMLVAYKIILKIASKEEKRIVFFGFLFFLIALLPFLGLGNVTSRYSYLSSVGIVFFLPLFFKKTYTYLLNLSDRYIAITTIIIIVTIFCSMQLFQLQKIDSDWHAAGEKSKKFLISLEGTYNDYWTKEHMEFYFVNVPIRHGEAWIFPVGLQDAVWFVFRNGNMNVHQESSLDQALDQIENPLNDKVFEFENTGVIIEKKQTKKLTTSIPVK